jgi:hypothetical protein
MMDACLKMDSFPWNGIASHGWSCTTPENGKPLPLHLLSAVTAFITPRRFDVLFGKGRVLRKYTGNVRVDVLVAIFRSKYEQADKHENTDIAKLIVNIIHESWAFVLKFEENEGCWRVEVENRLARGEK